MNIIIGMLTTILKSFYEVFGDWGISIIALTLIVKILLLPLSLKQKKSMDNQQEFFKKIEETKVKYKNQKDKLESEMTRLTVENSKNMLGCIIGFTQLPIIYSLYRLFSTTQMGTETILVPWVSSLKIPDPYYIIPVLVLLTQLLPNIISSLNILKNNYMPKLSIKTVLPTVILSLIITIKLPIAIGLYWMASSFISTIEQIIFVFIKRRSIIDISRTD